MLTDKQYEAIGRLALAFNEVETVIDEYCPHILGASEWEIATLLADTKAGFDRKASKFAKVIEAIAQHYGVLKPFTVAILENVKSAKELAEKRNEYYSRARVCRLSKERDKNEGERQGSDL